MPSQPVLSQPYITHRPKQTIIHLSFLSLCVNSDDMPMISQPNSTNLCLTNFKFTMFAFLTIHSVIHRWHAVYMDLLLDLIVFIAQHLYVPIQGGLCMRVPASQRFRHFVRSMDGPPLVCISTISASLEVKDSSLCLSDCRQSCQHHHHTRIIGRVACVLQVYVVCTGLLKINVN